MNACDGSPRYNDTSFPRNSATKPAHPTSKFPFCFLLFPLVMIKYFFFIYHSRPHLSPFSFLGPAPLAILILHFFYQSVLYTLNAVMD